MNKKSSRLTPQQRAQSRFITLKVNEASELLPFLMKRMGVSRTAAKSLLTRRLVYVNNRIETLYNQALAPGTEVKISRDKNRKEFNSQFLSLVYEDNYLIVVNKRQGLLSIATDKQKERTAYSILTEYVKRSHRSRRVFIVHRLDRDTSGLMVFAKDEKTKFTMQDNWQRLVADRRYVAVVCGVPERLQGNITSWLKENKVFVTYSNPTDNGGDIAVTHYRTLRKGTHYTLLELALETGRKNQIRVHMQEMGHPVVGDSKYGNGDDPIGRLALHAFRLSFYHPVTGELMNFETPLPQAFKHLVVKGNE